MVSGMDVTVFVGVGCAVVVVGCAVMGVDTEGEVLIDVENDADVGRIVNGLEIVDGTEEDKAVAVALALALALPSTPNNARFQASAACCPAYPENDHLALSHASTASELAPQSSPRSRSQMSDSSVAISKDGAKENRAGSLGAKEYCAPW